MDSSTNLFRVSPEFTKLLTEMFERGVEFGVYRLSGDYPGFYASVSIDSSFYTLSIMDYETGLGWVLFHGDAFQESEIQPFTSLADCLGVFDRAVMWDAKKDEDRLFPAVEWMTIN